MFSIFNQTNFLHQKSSTSIATRSTSNHRGKNKRKQTSQYTISFLFEREADKVKVEAVSSQKNFGMHYKITTCLEVR